MSNTANTTTKHTPTPWIATTMKGWGDSICIGPQGMTEPLLKLVRQKAYYTDYPRTDDGSIICSTSAAQRAGLYVATPEIQAEILKREKEDAAFIVRACNAHEQLVAALRDLIALAEQMNDASDEGGQLDERYDAALAALAAAGA